VCRETAFGARASGAITLDPAEHSAFEWVSQAEALSRVPHAGLARAIRLS
jgi:hypothetical protein